MHFLFLINFIIILVIKPQLKTIVPTLKPLKLPDDFGTHVSCVSYVPGIG